MPNERTMQFLMAALMVVAAVTVVFLALDRGAAAVIGASLVGAVLAVGAIALAQDRK